MAKAIIMDEPGLPRHEDKQCAGELPSISTNGCMRVVPGTHKQPMIPQRETYIPENALSRGQEIAVEAKEKDAVNLDLQPGDMSLHHIWIVHSSNANTSKDTPRIGIAIRYTKPEVVQESPMKPMAMLVHGRDGHGNFEILPSPKPGTHAQQTIDHKVIVDRIRAAIMTTAQQKPAQLRGNSLYPLNASITKMTTHRRGVHWQIIRMLPCRKAARRFSIHIQQLNVSASSGSRNMTRSFEFSFFPCAPIFRSRGKIMPAESSCLLI